MIVGMAVETTVESSAATARADMIPTAITSCSGVMPMRRATAWWRRRPGPGGGVGVTGSSVGDVMRGSLRVARTGARASLTAPQ